MDFEVDDEFKTTFKLLTNKISFKTHKQLDEFVHGLFKEDPEFQYKYKYEYYMLKVRVCLRGHYERFCHITTVTTNALS